ncbi:MAG: hypothetical protein QG612_263 [Pseudomonadota bacterium]|nr:hypothetical protein [Pseudomonadota bacterium]
MTVQTPLPANLSPEALMGRLEREIALLEHAIRLQAHDRIEPQAHRLHDLLARTMDTLTPAARQRRLPPDLQDRLRAAAIRVRDTQIRLARDRIPVDRAVAMLAGERLDPLQRGYDT